MIYDGGSHCAVGFIFCHHPYRQIKVAPEDRLYQLILWRENPSQPIEIYQLNTVTYGTSAAPYLATRCLTKLAEDSISSNPTASAALMKETYVDDIMTGAYSLETAKCLLTEVQKLLSTAKFELRKYCSNNSSILNTIPDAHKQPYLQIGSKEVVKTLGLIWQPSEDAFVYHFNIEPISIITKRTVLSNLENFLT